MITSLITWPGGFTHAHETELLIYYHVLYLAPDSLMPAKLPGQKVIINDNYDGDLAAQ